MSISSLAGPLDAPEIRLPKSSFVSFRLSYSDSKTISENAKTIFLGKVPAFLLDEKHHSFLSKSTHRARSKVQKKFKSTVSTIHSSVRGSSMHKGNDDLNYNEKFNRRLKNQVKTELRALRKQSKHLSSSNLPNLHRLSTELNRETIIDSEQINDSEGTSFLLFTDAREQDSTEASTYSFDNYNPHEDVKSPVKDFFSQKEETPTPIPIVINPAEFPDISDNYLDCHNESYIDNSGSVLSKEKLSPVETAPESFLNLQSTTTPNSKPKVKFDDSSNQRKGGSRISIALPEPENPTEDTFVKAAKEHERFRKKIKNLAKVSKGKAKVKNHDIRNKILNSLLKNYQAGEIIRSEKVLLLVKESFQVLHAETFNESEPFDTRVYERWHESVMIFRKSRDINRPFVIQFYDSRSLDNSKKKPNFQIFLSYSTRAQFYSCLDKSICLTVPNDEGLMIYIFKSHFQQDSLRWLSLIKQVTSDDLTQPFDVHVPELELAINFNVSQDFLSKFMDEEKFITFNKLDNGYQIRHSHIFEYLIQTVNQQLQELSYNKPNVRLFLEKTTNPWLCYKYYDRLEWVQKNAETFYLQNQLLSNTFHLEFRQPMQDPREIQVENTCLIEPYPIEGFLARLTNTLGKEVSFLRTFHKISYFYTSNNILFFTKYYRGTPPSPNNQLLKDDGLGLLNKEIPEIFLKSPFELDEHDHIAWLDSPEFEKYDEIALSDFERRTQQIAKAEGLLDLTLVKSIKAIPSDELHKTHKLLQCVLWYSVNNPSYLENEDIVDSAFQIELLNGSKIKLQASNRIIRDEWINHLNSLSVYWKARTSFQLKRINEVRKKNQDLLRINEYTDSNIVQESDCIEFKHSYADTMIHNIGSLSMSKCVSMSGILYQKQKKHSNFNQYYVVLCPGFLLLFTLYRRSKATGAWKKSSFFEHYMTIPIAESYVYSGNLTANDLLEMNTGTHSNNPAQHSLPRLYADGWKSAEEEPMCCFTLWFGRKRQIAGRDKSVLRQEVLDDITEHEKNNSRPKNPGIINMIRKLGFTGKSVVFRARSRQEREMWVSRIHNEIDRFSRN